MYLLEDHREVVSIYVDLIHSFDCMSDLNMHGLQSDLERYGIAGWIGNDPVEVIAYIMYSESILHHEMNSYFGLVPFMIGNLSEDGTFTISQYEFDVGFSTAYRANQIPSLITDDFSTLYREHGLELELFRAFQRRIKLWLFSRRLWNFISHTGIPRSAYG
jgi:hypothetical protein